MSDTRFVADLALLSANYDGFLVDQFGVLHDGRELYPHVPNALDRLKSSGKRVVILSNSGKRAAINEARLAGFGLDHRHYTALISSGEVAWQGFHEGREPPFADLGRRCLFFSRGGDLSAVTGLDLELVEDPAEADFVYLSGLDPESANRCQTILSKARGLELPLLCSNPDLIAIEGEGIGAGPGRFAEEYETWGGRVYWIGKPAPPIYRAALQRLGLPKSRILAIGDSLDHDVAGAAAAGLDSALLSSGIHREAFAGAVTAADHLQCLNELRRASSGKTAPTLLLPGFLFEGDMA